MTSKFVYPVLKLGWNQVGKQDNRRIASQRPIKGVEEDCNLAYIADNTREHLLDVYYPQAGTGPYPVIVDIHGGGWVYGYKELNRNYCHMLAHHGFVVFSINYRLAPHARFHEQIQDVFHALNWIQAHLGDYPADGGNLFLTGDSAGGHMALITAAILGDAQLRRLFQVPETDLEFNAIAATSPAIDLNGIMAAMKGVVMGDDYKTSPYKDAIAFESLYHGGPYPPCYLVTSRGDFLRNEARRLALIFEEYGVEYQPHDWDEKLNHVFSVTDPYSQQGRQTIHEMITFFRSHKN